MYKIEKGIELKKANKYPFSDMEVGDSFLVTDHTKHQSARSNAYLYGRNNDMTFTTVKQEDGMRVFRTK